MSKQQELADLKSAAAQEYEMQVDALDKTMALYDEDAVQYHEMANKKLVLAAQYNVAIRKA